MKKCPRCNHEGVFRCRTCRNVIELGDSVNYCSARCRDLFYELNRLDSIKNNILILLKD